MVKRIGAGLRCILEELVRRRVCRKRQPSGHHGWGVVKSLALIGSGPAVLLVCTENLDTGVVVMKFAQDGA